MAVREPILKELLAYKKAVSEAEKEAHRAKLRHLFERIDTNAAQPFEVMLSSPNALAVTFRDVLHNDSLQNELIAILAKKYMPAQCIPAAPAPALPAPLSGVTLPGVTLTDEASLDELHAVIEGQTKVLREASEGIVRYPHIKNGILQLVEVLSERLNQARKAKKVVFAMTDATKRAAGLKTIGNVYTGLLYVTQLWKLYVNIAVATDGAEAAGVLSKFARKPEQNPQAVRLADFENDNAINALNQAGLDANVPAMHSALPAARRAYELHATRLDLWITAIGKGAFLSKKVIQVADIAMIAISIYQVWKLPAVSGGSTTPPTILGTLPGGAALGSVVSLPSLARAVEAIRRLVAIGALDGALIGGVGSLGGGPSIALPELQRPTSLSVQTPGGSGPKLTTPSGTPNPPINLQAGKNFREHFVNHRAAVEKALGIRVGKLRDGGGEALLKALSEGINDGTFKYVGQGTLKKGAEVMNIYRGKGLTVVTKTNGEWVTAIRTGEGLDLGILITK
ncbi:MAG: hypothetical protein L6Q76_31370 [Polyangiaceae bacterium]|nr:hypothetical protein [Polyangiaceae bacterium]